LRRSRLTGVVATIAMCTRSAASKLTWLGVVALPLWTSGLLEGAFRHQVSVVLWVAIIIAVIRWRYVASQYVTAPAEPRRRPR
jgi:hypothetical protein